MHFAQARSAGEVVAGRYTLIRLLGEGKHGAAWEAHDAVLDQSVALKSRSHGHWAGRAVFRNQREARFGARLRGVPHVAHVYDHVLEPEQETSWVVMELIPGLTLSQRVERDGALPRAQIEVIAGALLTALAGIHDRGLLHGDIHPGNVLIGPDGRVTLVDFGSAVEITDGAPDGEWWRLSLASGSTELYRPLAALMARDPHRVPRPEFDLLLVGLLLVSLTTGEPPSDHRNHDRRDLALKAPQYADLAPLVSYLLADRSRPAPTVPGALTHLAR